MTRQKSNIWLIMFLIMIALPAPLYFIFNQYIDSENFENRDLATRPKWTIQNYDSFPQEYEAYFNDNILFRNQLIRLNNSLDFFVFKQSSSEKVAIGHDGWLFCPNNADGNSIEQSLGYWHFTDEQLQIIAKNLTLTKRVLENQGIGFVLFIAPNKETIYKDKLPGYYKVKSDYTSTEQLVDYLRENTDICLVYPKEELMEKRIENSEWLLYYKLDTHWNILGGYIGARALAEKLGIKIPSLDNSVIEPMLSSEGDLTKILNITIKNGNIDYKISGINKLDTQSKKHDFFTEFIYYTPGADSRRLFVKRGSYSTALALALAAQFENSIWVHNNNYEQQQIFDYDADIFVFETVERGERSLAKFKVSFISSSVENFNDGTKKIRIEPAIEQADLQYVSIFIENKNTNEIELVQNLQPFTQPMSFQFSENDSGRIFVNVYSDEVGVELLEDVVIKY